jgi:hypothetical protein
VEVLAVAPAVVEAAVVVDLPVAGPEQEDLEAVAAVLAALEGSSPE